MTEETEEDPAVVRFRAQLAALPTFDPRGPSARRRSRVRASARALRWALEGALLALYGLAGLAARGAWTLAGDARAWLRGHDFRHAYAAASERGRGRDMDLIATAYRDAVAWRRGRAGAWLVALALGALYGWHRAPVLLAVAGVLAVVALAVVGARARADEFDDAADDGDVIDAEIVDTPGMAGPPPPWPLRHGGTVDTRRGVPVGFDDDGAVITLALDRSALVAGCTGSGKSQMIRGLACGVLADPAAELHLWSAKSDRDFRDLAPACATFGGGPGAMGALSAVLARLVDELGDREAAGGPPCVVIVDELHHALAHHEHGPRITASVTALAELGRSAGVILVGGVQRPTKASVPPRVAEQMEIRIGCRVRTPGESRILFGESAVADGLRPDLFPADRPGLAWVDGHGPAPVRIRGWMISDADAAAVVAAAAGRRSAPLAIDAPPPPVDDRPARSGCPVCGAPVADGATYCGSRCRTRAYRARRDQR